MGDLGGTLTRRLGRLAREVAGGAKGIAYTDEGNRSIVRLNYRSYLRDPHLLRLFTEYQATGNFTGHLCDLSPEDAEMVREIREGLRALRKAQGDRGYAAGPMWAKWNDRMLGAALAADPRLYNHIGALNYKSFEPQALSLEAVILEVLRTLVLHDYFRERTQDFGGLFTGLNSRHFTLEGCRLNAGLRAIEEKLLLEPVLARARERGGRPRVLEIGAGSGQLANLLCRGGARMVVIDLPGMHARAPYFLYKSSGLRVCTYSRFLSLDRDLEGALERYDVVYLPPWEKEALAPLRFDLGVNVHSLGEMSVGEVRGYLALVRESCGHFFSINTSTRDLDPRKQPGYSENGTLFQEVGLGMKLVATGTPLFDTAFQKTAHYGYALYQRAQAAGNGGGTSG